MSKTNISEEMEAVREKFLNNLSPEHEDILQNIHAEQYRGCDDDMCDDFDNWLCDLTIMDLEEYLEIELIN